MTGGATIETSYEAIQLDRVGGAVELTVHHGGVEGKGLAQGVRVRASGGDVTLDGFSGPADVELERGNARLAPRAAITAPLTVVRQDTARPSSSCREGSRVDVQAESSRGEVHADVPELDVAGEHERPGPGHRLSGRVGGGGSRRDAARGRRRPDLDAARERDRRARDRQARDRERERRLAGGVAQRRAGEAPLAKAKARPPAAPRPSAPPAEKTP